MTIKGRLLSQTLASLSVECLPDKLPPEIRVDLSPLEEVEQAIHVKDLVLDPAITVANNPNQLIAKVSEKAAKVEEEVAKVEVEAAAEPEAPPTE
jgi:hypothetical protein